MLAATRPALCALMAVGLFCVQTPGAERSANWRVYRAVEGLADSYCAAVSLSPRGNVWVKHNEADFISVFTGYTIHTLPSPGQNSFRVYEGRSGQLWSLSTNGLVLFDGKQWVEHPVAEIRSETESDPLRRMVRQIPLVPADQEHVLFLLADSLREYDAVQRKTQLIRSVGNTRLGRFVEMAEGRDDTLWITGAKGLARIRGPLRQIGDRSSWEEFIPPENLGIQNLQRPYEDKEGQVTMVAFLSPGAGRRAIVHFDQSNWKVLYIPDELLKQAWRDWDGETWSYSMNSLFRFSEGRQIKENFWAGQLKDAVTATNGAFWLASSEGLVRYAPFLWRTPLGARELSSLVHAILPEASGEGLWFAASDGLAHFAAGEWKSVRWPANYEPEFKARDALYRLADGRIAVSGAVPQLYRPQSGEFQTLVDQSGQPLRLLGQLPDSSVVVEVASGGGANFETFDGREFRPLMNAGPVLDLGELNFFMVRRTNEFWVGGSNGVGVYRDGKWQKFGRGQGYSLERALCIVEVAENKLWVGTANQVWEYDNGKWSVAGSGFDRVHALVKGKDGKIWAATGSGVECFFKGSWVAHSTDEGLPSSAIYSVAEDKAGGIWAGTALGLALYHPDADLDPPRVLTPEVDRGERAASAGYALIHLSAVDKWYSTPRERMLFSYRLDEAPWSPYTNIFVKVFEHLGAGDHRFQVRAMDRNWNESLESTAVEFSVLMPWYREKRLLVIMALGLALVVALGALAINRHMQLVRSYAAVGRIVAVRTRELERANQELLHSQKMKALGTLAAGIAHDFNNILSIIKGSVQIIENHPEDKEKIRTRISRIKTVVEQGSGIVKSMLGLSRVGEQDFEDCNFNQLVEETIKLLSDRFPQELNVRTELAADLPVGRGAKELIQQMLVNLILNAIDALSGKGDILLKTGRWHRSLGNLALAPAQAPGYIFIQVEDTGHGIAAEVLPRIFEPFFTTKAFSTRRGTGLGLSMVYELAKHLGYGLAVESMLGKGSTFSILIPVRR